MNALDVLWHVLGAVAPAWGLAALLAPLLAWRGRRARPVVAAWGVHLLWLGAVGSAVLIGGLWWTGQDGRMATYAALVAAVGLVAAWRDAPARR